MTNKIINITDYVKLKKLLESSKENKNLALQIIDKSNIKESFVYILAIIGHSQINVSSKLPAIENYIISLAPNDSRHLLPYSSIFFNLDQTIQLTSLLYILELHAKKPHNKTTAQDKKFIIKECTVHSAIDTFTFNPHLKPKDGNK